ncbi:MULTISPECIES: hypothetical protein [unclassified Streptomyces]|uniref:hypothetical protein n=1 Tax=unclassified Streptomyces TaxID=2593676 RepID=UPI0036E8E911
MGDAYFAEPARIQAGLLQMHQISSSVEGMVDDFLSEVKVTMGWPGLDDSFAQEVKPQERKERESSSTAATALSEAVAGVVHGTTVNLREIQTNQNNILDAIQDHRNKTGNGRRH